VAAALNGTAVPGHILSIVDAIMPPVASAKGQPGDPLDNAIRANVRLTVERLKGAAPILAEKVKAAQLKIVGAIYSLDTGKVDVIA